MKFTNAALAASTMALVSAAPTMSNPAPIGDNEVFRIMSIRTGSSYGNFQAADGSLFINTASQNSTCCTTSPDGSPINYASFYLSNGSLFLNTPSGQPPQEFFVDRSGMGQGVIQYTTGDIPVPSQFERGPFSLDANNFLMFGQNKDVGFQACPNQLFGGNLVWLAGQTNPGGNTGCFQIIANAVREDEAIECTYTSTSA